jgi:lipoprotein NlpD
MKIIYSLILISLIVGCATRIAPAPIENATHVPDFLLTNKPLPADNNSSTPVAVPPPAATTTPLTNNNTVTPIAVQVVESTDNSSSQSASPTPAQQNLASDWILPSAGRIGKYSATKKGVEIYGTLGQNIYATHSGKVVYSGNGLKGYGNLIIIKHDNTYLSAYAYNKENLVHEGQNVNAGDKIATMGNNNDSQPDLHFEIRKNGKPIDPNNLINQQ